MTNLTILTESKNDVGHRGETMIEVGINNSLDLGAWLGNADADHADNDGRQDTNESCSN
jgi:hypothetical protein